MKAYILSLTSPTVQGKTYTHTINGHAWTNHNMTVPVLHKRTIKPKQRKELGDNMSVFVAAHREQYQAQAMDTHAALHPLMLHQGYDEQLDQSYYYLPHIASSKRKTLSQHITKLLGQSITITHQDTTTQVQGISTNDNSKKFFQTPKNINQIISRLTMVSLLYGNLQCRGTTLQAIKCHLPLIGTSTNHATHIQEMITTLAQHHLYIYGQIHEQENGLIYDITITDYELLTLIAHHYKDIATIDHIAKHDVTIHAIQQLTTYCQEHGHEKLLQTIQNGTIKLLTKK